MGCACIFQYSFYWWKLKHKTYLHTKMCKSFMKFLVVSFSITETFSRFLLHSSCTYKFLELLFPSWTFLFTLKHYLSGVFPRFRGLFCSLLYYVGPLPFINIDYLITASASNFTNPTQFFCFLDKKINVPARTVNACRAWKAFRPEALDVHGLSFIQSCNLQTTVPCLFYLIIFYLPKFLLEALPFFSF